MQDEPEAGRRGGTRIGRLVSALLLVAAALLLAMRTIAFNTGSGGPVVDFDVFYQVGRMVAAGQAAAAYRVGAVEAQMMQAVGHAPFLPWTYPPPYDLMVGALARLPLGWAYLVFEDLSLAAFVLVLVRLAGLRLAAALLLAAPAIVVNLGSGQNGLLTAALGGGVAFALLAQHRRAGDLGGGLALGLLVMKPQLALGLGVLALGLARWRMIGIAGGLAVVLSGVATVAFGVAIWPAFLGAAMDAGRYLAEGRFALPRMISVYALARTGAGLGAGAGLAVQTGATLLAAAVILIVARRAPPRVAAGLALLLTPAFSPYGFDYDLALIGPAAGLLLAEMRGGFITRLVLLALFWLACMPALVLRVTPGIPGAAGTAGQAGYHGMAFGALAYWLAVALTAVLLCRKPVRGGNGRIAHTGSSIAQ